MAGSDYMAAVALVISFLSFGVSFYFGFRDQVHLRATSKLYNGGEDFGPPYIMVRVVNHGRRVAILTMFGGELDNGAWIGTCMGKDGRGIRLAEHEYHVEKVSLEDLQEFAVPDEKTHEYTELWFEDSLGKRHPVRHSRRNIQKLKKG